MAKPQPSIHIEENGIMYVTKRISAHQKITIPVRKRKGNQVEKCKVDGVETFTTNNGGKNSEFSILDTSGSIFNDAVSTFDKQDDFMGDNTSSNYSLQSTSGISESYEMTQTPRNGNVTKTVNPRIVSPMTEHAYSQSQDQSYYNDTANNGVRYSDTSNPFPPVLVENSSYMQNSNSYSQTKVLMPNYYYYNKQLMSQIVKQLQITIQNILSKNAGIYTCYDTGVPSGWEIHNPKEGPVIHIQFKQSKQTKDDNIDLFPSEGDDIVYPTINHNTYDKSFYPLKRFKRLSVAKKSTGFKKPTVKSCYVKIDKLSEDYLTSSTNENDCDLEEGIVKEEPVSDDSSSEDTILNRCGNCHQTFRLRIQLIHHKCKVPYENGESFSSDKVVFSEKQREDVHEGEFLAPACPKKDEASAENTEHDSANDKVVPLSEIENIIMNPELTIYEMNDDESMSNLQQSLYCSKCVNCAKEIVGKEGEYCEKCEMEGSLNSNDQEEHRMPKHPPSSDVVQAVKKPKPTLATNYQECPYCKKRFSPYYSLKYHTSKCDKNTHCLCKLLNMNNANGGNPVQCYLCEGKNEVEVQCRVCQKTFSNNNKLRRHMLIHSGVKRYVCSQCGKRFGRSDHLKLHKQTHSGTKPYMCSTCGKCFTTKQSVKFHMRLHSGVKPYCCNFCGKRFVQLAALKTHLQVHSSNKAYRRRTKIA